MPIVSTSGDEINGYANLGRSICPYNQFRLITLLAASLHVGRPRASNELPWTARKDRLSVPVPFTSHPICLFRSSAISEAPR